MLADGLAPIWYQDISDHPAELRWPVSPHLTSMYNHHKSGSLHTRPVSWIGHSVHNENGRFVDKHATSLMPQSHLDVWRERVNTV